MEITEALNYMKTIIDNAKERGNSTINVRKALKEYMGALVQEKLLEVNDFNVLAGVVSRVDPIMKSKMTVDEAFVRSMCDEQQVKYHTSSLENKEEKLVKPVRKSTKYTVQEESKKPEPKKKNREPREETRRSDPWDSFPVPEYARGSCGRAQEAAKKTAYEEWRDSLRSDDGIWSKCRH